MPDVELEPPSDWTEYVDTTQPDSALVEYQYDSDDETTFIVSVLRRTTGDAGYQLTLSTITRTPARIRHDYPIDEYETLEEAVSGAESFLEQFSRRLRDGSISSHDPTIKEIEDTIQAFTAERQFSSVRRFLRRFR